MPEATKRASLPRPDGGKVSVLIGPSIRGAMAQLVARLVRNEKVRGSSPLSSTRSYPALTRCGTGAVANLRDVIRTPLLACAPFVLPAVQTVQTGPICRGSQMVQIEVGSGNRCVSHPCLYGHRINSAGQPEAGRRVWQVVGCAVRRCGSSGGERPSPLSCRSRAVKLRAA